MKIKELIEKADDKWGHIPYRIKYWWHDMDIFHPTRIYRKVGNIVRWIPILWRDEDWDHSHLLDIMAFKIKNMREHQEQHHNHLGWEKLADQMKLAEECLKRVRKDEYWTHQAIMDLALPDDIHEEEVKKVREREEKEGAKLLEWVSPWPEEHSKEIQALNDKEEELRRQDLETFARIFVKHVRSWWD